MQYQFIRDNNGKDTVQGRKGTVVQHADNVCVAGGEVHAADPRDAEPFEVSKLSLRRALRQIGLEPALNAFLAANPTAKADWDDATIIRTDDPLLVAAMPALCAQAGISAEQAQALLESCRV
jgi:hypothetical protein